MQETLLNSELHLGQRWLQGIQSYIQLTKPKIIFLLLVTTAGGMWLASKGQLDPWLMVVTLTGGALASGAANTLNMVYDCDIDEVMQRTHSRPMPSGRIRPRDALIFAAIMALSSFCLLAQFANLLAAWLAMSGIVVYVGVYTHWLKRLSPHNIVIGGAAGAIPPLVGWAAVTGSLDWPAWILFTIIFLWTPPHFWALAILKRDDYARAGIPMLPVVAGNLVTAQQILLYSIAMLPTTLLLVYPFHIMGAFFGSAAVVLGLYLIYKAWQLLQDSSNRDRALAMFLAANFYLLLLYLAMAIDMIPFTQQGIHHLSTSLHQWG